MHLLQFNMQALEQKPWKNRTGDTAQENTNRLRIIHWQSCQQQKLSLFIRQKISAHYWERKGPC